MKKYKSNYMFSYIFQYYNCLLGMFPGLLIFLISENEISDLHIFHMISKYEVSDLEILHMYISSLLLTIVVGNTIHFLICLFTKHKVYIDEEFITVKEGEILTESIKIEDITLVLFDPGMILKNGIVPCSLTLFTDDFDKNLNVNHPSFFMILEIKKRCKQADFKFNDYQWYIVWCSICTVFSAVLCFFMK